MRRHTIYAALTASLIVFTSQLAPASAFSKPLTETQLAQIQSIDPADSRTTLSMTTSPKQIRSVDGTLYTPSVGFDGGWYSQLSSKRADVRGTADDAIYRHEWTNPRAWSHPIPNGSYMATLKFRDASSNAVNQRVFDVTAEGAVALSNLDIFAHSGRTSALDKTFRVNVTDGRIDLSFRKKIGYPVVSAIVLSQVLTTSTPNTCVNSDGTACPASYFTGPLGQQNILPNGRGALLIDQYGGQGTEWPEAKKGIIDREERMGRKFDSIQIHVPADPNTGDDKERWILSTGHSFVTVAWNPSYDIAAINSGALDQTFRAGARYWKQFSPSRVMIRSFTEFNLRDSVVRNSCGPPFTSAWQRMVKIFKEEGAVNVGFWWVPDEGNNRQCILDSYPGDAYVDWVGSDAYNWCLPGSKSCYSTPPSPGPATFEQVFNYSSSALRSLCPNGPCPTSQHDSFGARKPFVIGETGTVLDPAANTFKQQFFDSVSPGAKNMKYLRGISFFDCDVSSVEGPRTNFRIDAPLNDLGVWEAFKRLANDSWFKVGVKPNQAP